MEQPLVVVVASALQLIIAATFVVIPVVGYLFGARAQRAAEAEVEAQGYPPGLLAERGVKFNEGPVDILLPVAIALSLIALASLNLAGRGVGRTLSLVVQPILLVAGGLVTAGQVFTVRYIESAFRRAADPTLQGISVRAFVEAARDAFPAWLPYLVAARFVLLTVGSVIVIALLATPAASGYFG
jgi:hypothetical protein